MAKTEPSPEPSDRPATGGSYVVKGGKLHRKSGPAAPAEPAPQDAPEEPKPGAAS